MSVKCWCDVKVGGEASSVGEWRMEGWTACFSEEGSSNSLPHLLWWRARLGRLYNLVGLIALFGYSEEEFRAGERGSSSALSHYVILSMPCLSLHTGLIPFSSPFPLYQLVEVQPIVATRFFYICARCEQRLSVRSTGGLPVPEAPEDARSSTAALLSLLPRGARMRAGLLGSPAFTLWMGLGGLGRSSPFFPRSRTSPAMPQCWWFLCCCCWASWTPSVPGRAAQRARPATPGSEGMPGVAEACMSTSEERRGAGSSTAPPNTTFRSTPAGR